MRTEWIPFLILWAIFVGAHFVAIFAWPKAANEYGWRTRLRIHNLFSNRWLSEVRPEHVEIIRRARRKATIAYSIMLGAACAYLVWLEVETRRRDREVALEEEKTKRHNQEFERLIARAAARRAATSATPSAVSSHH